MVVLWGGLFLMSEVPLNAPCSLESGCHVHAGNECVQEDHASSDPSLESEIPSWSRSSPPREGSTEQTRCVWGAEARVDDAGDRVWDADESV